MNRLKLTFLVPFLFLSTIGLTIGASAQKASYLLVSAPLVIDQKTAVPGHILKEGTYTIRIIEHFRDRFILQVDDTKGAAIATFIGLHNPEFNPFDSLKNPGPIFWTASPKKNQKAARGFSFPNGNTLEFVYPKAEAVTLAKLNSNTVPAVDPESEGMKPDPNLSTEDREIVALWMLSPTQVGPKSETPAIAAKRFVAPVEPTSSTPGSVQSAGAISAPSQPSKQSRPTPVLVAKAEPAQAPRIRSTVKRLPQTASELPLALLLSLMSLGAAASLRLGRVRS